MNSFLDLSLDSLDLNDVDFGGDDFADAENRTDCKPLQDIDEDRKAFIDKIITYFLRHNTSLVGLEDLMELLNYNREPCDKFPTNKVQIMKLFRQQRDLFDVFFFVKCATCSASNKIDSESLKSKCLRCENILKRTETNFFVTIPIEQQIKKSVSDNWKYISKFVDSFSKDSDSEHFSDAHDGKILKDVLQQYAESDINILPLCLNIDGANKYKSNVLSVWPIQLLQNYLPPNIRFAPDNIIVSGLHYDHKKPNCYEFMLPLINELNAFSARTITMDIDGVEYIFKPVITSCSVDLPAKSLLQETKQFGSFHGCTYCNIPGESIAIKKLGTNDSQKTRKKKAEANAATDEPAKESKFVRYVEGDEPYALRDEVEMLQTMLAISKSSSEEAVNGVKGVSCLVSLEHFNIIFSMGVDYMHGVLLGAQKRILNYFCNSNFKAKDYYIRPKKRKVLNAKLLAIKPTSNITRKPRSLDHRKNFKASEFRSLLLYYLPVCLPGCVPNIYVNHVRRLSAAVYTLLKTKISHSEVDEAERMLHTFVRDHQTLFGKEGMVMVIHLLKHLSDSVRHLGPLWCHSAFAFERNNGCLLNLVNGTTDVLHQMSSKYTLSKSLPKKFDKIGGTMFLGKSINIDEKSLIAQNIGTTESFDLSNVTSVYMRLRLNNVIYTSLLYVRPKKSIDYFIGMKDSTIGMARFYFELDKKMYVLIEQFEIIDSIYHIDKVRKTNNTIVAPVECIEKKFIFMKLGLNQFIVLPPNPYENE